MKYRKNTKRKKPKVKKVKNGRILFSSNCVIYGSEKLRFIKDQEAYDFLIGLSGIKSPLEGIPILESIT